MNMHLKKWQAVAWVQLKFIIFNNKTFSEAASTAWCISHMKANVSVTFQIEEVKSMCTHPPATGAGNMTNLHQISCIHNWQLAAYIYNLYINIIHCTE